ncbi:hypothetical protein PHYPO_G00113870 [Pangasianodon hypophthalmus]|uniref:Uncharacterized protein n=1 Tax=Pangasianodon hypophthalmus TaxID=310915 RepID=A0A5N5L2P1_PANHP|nr:hypothetical protein PHYPO_G00113870 [Pangasianodon hypophthalmus]
MMEDVKALIRFQNRRPAFTVGSVGPYNIQVQSLNMLMEDSKVSDEVMDSVCNVLSKVGKKDVPPNVLQQPTKAKTKVTIFSTLTEGEAEDLAMALAKRAKREAAYWDTQRGQPSNTEEHRKNENEFAKPWS